MLQDFLNQFYKGKNGKKLGKYYIFSHNNGYGTVKIAYRPAPYVEKMQESREYIEKRFPFICVSEIPKEHLYNTGFVLQQLLYSKKVDLNTNGSIYFEGTIPYFEFKAMQKRLEKYIYDEQLAEDFIVFD
jgi:hypothetical protein